MLDHSKEPASPSRFLSNKVLAYSNNCPWPKQFVCPALTSSGYRSAYAQTLHQYAVICPIFTKLTIRVKATLSLLGLRRFELNKRLNKNLLMS